MTRKINGDKLNDIELAKIRGGSNMSKQSINDLSQTIVCFKGVAEDNKNLVLKWFKNLGRH